MQTEEHAVLQLSPALGAQELVRRLNFNGLPRNILRFPIEGATSSFVPDQVAQVTLVYTKIQQSHV